MAQKPLVENGFLTIEASRSQSDTPQSVGLLWTGDQPDAETHNTHKNRHLCPWRYSNPQSQQRKRPHTYALDRAATGIGLQKKKSICF
jgi:hypothetical protein